LWANSTRGSLGQEVIRVFARSADAASRTTAVLLVVLCLAYALAPFLSVDPRRTGVVSLAVMAVGVLAFYVAFTRVTWRAVRGPVPTDRRRVDLVVSAIVAVAMCLRFGLSWAPLIALSTGAAVLALSRHRALAFAGVTLFAEVLAGASLGASAIDMVKLLGEAVVVTAVVYTLGWLARLGQELDRSRAELARLAVLEERLRFARDLHDVLGHTLSVIALKSEAAARLGPVQPDRALTEMSSVADIARGALGDVRALVRGYRQVSLEAEVDGVVGILRAAGIHCDVTVPAEPLPGPVRDVFGWVVREAVTNVLRHSTATRCAITLRAAAGEAVLEIVNDGAPPGTSRAAGNGLAGLAERLGSVGGRLASEHAGGEFRLVAAARAESGGGE
jgi:two-component system sensor histidine kinase DesK